MKPIVLSGGSGTRLWPLSRSNFPKQFVPLFEEPLQTMTVRRLLSQGTPWVVGSAKMKLLGEKNLKDSGIDGVRFISEPFGRDTSGAIALICKIAELEGFSEEVLGIFPSDHLITKLDVFNNALKLADTLARQGRVVTLGIKPTEPATGYGYIQTEKTPFEHGTQSAAHAVHKFHEKPNQEVAVQFLKEGSYYWNAGIFVFKASQMISLFKKFQPQIWQPFDVLKKDLSNIREVFEKIPSISVDFSIMEKLTSSELACIPFDPGWSDVGSWDAVVDVWKKKSNPPADTLEVDAKNNFAYPFLDKTYAFLGVDDLIVVDCSDTVLITKKGQTQDVKSVVSKLKDQGSHLILDHTFDERPWGKFEILRDSETYKSKTITVAPGQQISYQSHAKREEHWIIVSGEGSVILNDETIPVKRGSYVHIPQGAKHRVRANKSGPLHFIEVQLGSYFGEDDIVRYEDDYQRS